MLDMGPGFLRLDFSQGLLADGRHADQLPGRVHP
jgi:hypothetical protein